jgi:hypothetical protein
MPVEDAVVGRLVMDHGLAPMALADRPPPAAPVVDFDRLGGVARLRQRLGDHDRDMVADIAHLALRQRRVRRPSSSANRP